MRADNRAPAAAAGRRPGRRAGGDVSPGLRAGRSGTRASDQVRSPRPGISAGQLRRLMARRAPRFLARASGSAPAWRVDARRCPPGVPAVEQVPDRTILHRHHDVPVGPKRAGEQPCPLQLQVRVAPGDRRYDGAAHRMPGPVVRTATDWITSAAACAPFPETSRPSAPRRARRQRFSTPGQRAACGHGRGYDREAGRASARAVISCSSCGLACGTTTAGFLAAATAAREFKPACVTTTSARHSAVHGSSAHRPVGAAQGGPPPAGSSGRRWCEVLAGDAGSPAAQQHEHRMLAAG